MTSKYPAGIDKDRDGAWKIRATKVDPRTHKLRVKKATLPASFTLKDAVLKHDELVRAILNDSAAMPEGETLSDYAKSWLTRKLPDLESEQTRQRYAIALDLHILPQIERGVPALGDLLVKEIRGRDLEMWRARCTQLDRYEHRKFKGEEIPEGYKGPVSNRPRPPAAPYSPETINGWLRVLTEVVQAAVIEYGLAIDPTRQVAPLPKLARDLDDNNSLSADELTAVLRACRHDYPQWWAFMFLGFSIGARPGELRPLRWDRDLNPTTGQLIIQRSERNGYVGKTKTKTPRVTLLAPPVLEALLWHREFLRRSWHPGAGSGLVFPGVGDWSKGGPCFLAASGLDNPLAEMCKTAGITRRITQRTMRRTFNDLTRTSGVDGLVIRSLTGHRSEEMRDGYSTIALEERRAASAKVLNLMPALGLPDLPEDKSGDKLRGNKRHSTAICGIMKTG